MQFSAFARIAKIAGTRAAAECAASSGVSLARCRGWLAVYSARLVIVNA